MTCLPLFRLPLASTLKLAVLCAALILAPMAAFAGTAVDVKMEGMHCGACSKLISDELSKVPEIEKDSITVTLEGQHATLTLKNDNPKSRAAVEAAVKKAGYKVSKIDVLPTSKTN